MGPTAPPTWAGPFPIRSETIGSRAGAAAANLSLDCDNPELRGRREVSISAGERLTHRSEGSMHMEAGADLAITADAQRLRARRGDIELAANDDVAVDGERIRLNSPLVRGR